jgi:hypothetical protein
VRAIDGDALCHGPEAGRLRRINLRIRVQGKSHI